MKTAARALGLALALAAALLPARAETDAAALDLDASLRLGAWSGSRRLDEGGAIARGALWGRGKVDLGEGGRAVADGWVAAQSRDGAGAHARMRELYWQGSRGPWDWKLGRQIVAWGRADGLNPTDNLSPRDYTLLAPGDNEQRRGNDGAQLRLDTGHGVVSGVWFARGASHTLPLPQDPQLSYDVQAPPRRSQWGVKFDLAGDGWDGSVSYFDGSDPVPDLALAGVGPAGLALTLRNQPLRVLGADFSLTRGGVVWRAEAAWLRSDSGGADDHAHKKPRLWLVGGPEFTLADNLTLGLQASVQRVQDFRSPDTVADPVAREVAWRQAALSNQTAATQTGVVWRLAGRWRNDTLSAEVNGVALAAPASALLRTRVAYAVNDRVQVQAGTDFYRGPQHSLWGQFRANRLAFVQLRVGL